MCAARVGRLSEAEVATIRKEMASATRGTHGAAAALYGDLRGLTASQIQQVLSAVVGRYERDALKEIAGRVAEAGHAGALAAVRSVGKQGNVLGILGGGSEAGAEWLARRKVRGGWSVAPASSPLSSLSGRGDVVLSHALHGTNPAGIVARMGDAIEQAVRSGQTASATAAHIRDHIGHEVRFEVGGPRGYSVEADLAEITKATRRMFRASGSPDAMQDFAAVRRRLEGWQQRLTKGGATARETLEQIDRAIARGSQQAVDRAVEWQIWHQERAHLELIVENETQRAWNQAYIENAADAPWVTGFEWHIDGDACDVCLERLDGHSEGMPSGCYTREDIARLMPPVHPHCHCYLLEVVDLSLV
jgi:hypothetical protein